MKKIVTLILCVLMVVSLAACSNTSSTAQTSQAAEDTAAQSTAAQSEAASGSSDTSAAQINLTVTSWRTDDLDSWNSINAEFTKAYPNITVTFNPVTATEYDGVLMTNLKSGNAADIINLRAWGSGRQIYDAGYVMDLSEEDIPNLSQLPDAAKVVWENDQGVSYGVPGSVCYGGFFYNKDIFDQCGVTAPTTWDEFLQACEAIKAKGITPISFGIKDSWMVSEYLSSTIIPATSGGSAWHDKLMNKEVDFTDAAYVKHFEWIKELANYFPEGYEGVGYTDMQQLFLSGNAAIYPVGTFDMGYLQKTAPEMNLGFFFMPDEDPSNTVSINTGFIMGYAINSKIDSSKVEAAKTYLNWLADVDASQMFGNYVLGQYAVNPAATSLENALSAECATTASKGDIFQQMPYQKLSNDSPDYTTAISEAVYKLLMEGATPEEAAQYMQETMAWYFSK